MHLWEQVFTLATSTVQKIKFFIKDFFSKCDQICRKLWIWSHLLKKSLMENFIFCAMKNDLFLEFGLCSSPVSHASLLVFPKETDQIHHEIFKQFLISFC